MLIKEEKGDINFIDKNDAFVGYDYSASCCEDFGFYVSREANTVDEDINLASYWFDTSVEPIDFNGDDIAFKCINEEGDVCYLHLYNYHNGYYSHGWKTSWGCDGYL